MIPTFGNGDNFIDEGGPEDHGTAQSLPFGYGIGKHIAVMYFHLPCMREPVDLPQRLAGILRLGIDQTRIGENATQAWIPLQHRTLPFEFLWKPYVVLIA